MQALRWRVRIGVLATTMVVIGGIVGASGGGVEAFTTVPDGAREGRDTGACHPRAACASPIMGGIHITSAGWSCTAGFRARGVSDGKRYLITAGHCLTGSGLFALWSLGKE